MIALQRRLGRRSVVTGLAVSLSFAWSNARAALSTTPRTTAGPFYPREFPVDSDNDLIVVGNRHKPAFGESAYLSGRVLDRDGTPISGAKVEIWQCDAQGRYHHPDSRRGPADPGFQGFGRTLTGAGGSYRFRTIKPVRYPGRTPHIHFLVAPPQGPRLITQMYIAGHPDNDRDFLYRRALREASSPAAIAATFEQSEDDDSDWVARFDLVV